MVNQDVYEALFKHALRDLDDLIDVVGWDSWTKEGEDYKTWRSLEQARMSLLNARPRPPKVSEMPKPTTHILPPAALKLVVEPAEADSKTKQIAEALGYRIGQVIEFEPPKGANRRAVDGPVTDYCTCPIEDYRDYPDGAAACLVCGRPMRTLIEEAADQLAKAAAEKIIKADPIASLFTSHGFTADHPKVPEVTDTYKFKYTDAPPELHLGDEPERICTHPPGCTFCAWCGFEKKETSDPSSDPPSPAHIPNAVQNTPLDFSGKWRTVNGEIANVEYNTSIQWFGTLGDGRAHTWDLNGRSEETTIYDLHERIREGTKAW